MAYQFRVNTVTCINCGICMDLCPVRCLDMTRPAGVGAPASDDQRQSPIPGPGAERPWMMLTPVQVAACIGCEVCAHECPTNAITIAGAQHGVAYAERGQVSHLPAENGWQPLDAYTRAFPEEPGETPWGAGHAWKVAGLTGALAGVAHLVGRTQRRPPSAVPSGVSGWNERRTLRQPDRRRQIRRGAQCGVGTESLPGDLWTCLHRAM